LPPPQRLHLAALEPWRAKVSLELVGFIVIIIAEGIEGLVGSLVTLRRPALRYVVTP